LVVPLTVAAAADFVVAAILVADARDDSDKDGDAKRHGYLRDGGGSLPVFDGLFITEANRHTNHP
jgi:hypothetical protein